MARYLLQPASLILIAVNLIPLVGVLLWGWDAFVLLMLYWLETAVIAFWTVARIATMPPEAFRGMKPQGPGSKPASPPAVAAFITVHAGLFMAVHFLFLWFLFSGEWSKKVRGVGAFVEQIVIGTGLWVPLLVLFVGRGVLMLLDAAKPYLWQRFGFVEGKPSDKSAIGPAESIIIALYLRIFVMQLTLILGVWLALLAGSTAALAFLIVLKTVVDLSVDALTAHVHASWMKAKAKNESSTASR